MRPRLKGTKLPRTVPATPDHLLEEYRLFVSILHVFAGIPYAANVSDGPPLPSFLVLSKE